MSPSGPRARLTAILASLSALVALAWGAAPAQATFHEMWIREIYPGSLLQPDAEYVELQMWSPAQNFVGGHALKTYNSADVPIGTTTFAGDVPGGANQSTILLGTLAAESAFGVVPDAVMAPNQLDPLGGAVCWAETIDCVSWGGFSGSLTSPAGSPATPAGIPDGMALRRTISPGCATLLEATDDRDNSAADFSPVFPSPRPNSVAPTERACTASAQPGTGGPSSQGPHGAPQTTLKRKPPRKGHDRTPTFRFVADESGSSFQCKLDSRPFKTCRSPFTTTKLSLGRHTFKVRARDDSGELDPTPAACSFRLLSAGRR